MQRQPYPYNPIPLRASRTVTQQYPDVSEDDAMYPQRQPSSTIRYMDTQGNQVIQRGKKRIVIHNTPPPKRKIHWSLIFSIGMVLMLLLGVGVIWLSNWWTNHQLDAMYGMPRTYQTDAIVYPGDSAANPSHYIFLNLNGTVQIIELPHGDSSHARIYKGPTLFSDNADLIPVTGKFKTVNGKIEMLVHIQDKTIIYVNDGTQFKPQQ
jgi:hypothetical protein